MRHAIATGMAAALFMGFGLQWEALAQGKAPPEAGQRRLAELQQIFKDEGVATRAAARQWAATHAIPLRRELPNGRVLELQRLGPQGPVFYITHNLDAADSISTDELWPGGGLGLILQGQGLTVGEWDSGRVLLEHPDLYPRSVQMDEGDDPAPVHSDHATHVAGTLVGSGGSQYVQARGMAPAANLQAWDWNRDFEEMAAAAASGLLVSNHSYSIAAGWIPYGQAEPDNWWWIGGPGDEDPNFGYYGTEARALDQIANAAPHYLMVKAAGNDRWDIGPAQGETYTIVDQNGVSLGTSTQSRPADCSQTGYDCLPGGVVAKNILTVGAVNDVIGGYLPLQGPGSVQLTGFSSFGPTDDGRIKPDLVANGWLLLSTWGEPNYFAVIAGTSMAAPSVSGSLLLLQEHYEDRHGPGNFMRAATLKALAIHSADETGASDGPDYEYGWGLMNTRKAAELITADGNGDHRIVEATRTESPTPDTVAFTVSEDNARVRVTLVWNDPAGTPLTPQPLNSTVSMLVNDLDLRVTGNSSTYQPWKLNPLSPAAAATRGDNTRDNVEVVEFVASAGSYTAQVSHKPVLQGGSQDYSLIISVRPPAPLSSGLLIDEGFDDAGLPAGWSVETTRGYAWDIYQDGVDGQSNGTQGGGGFAMLLNIQNNSARTTTSSLVLPPLDLSGAESVLLRFKSYLGLLDGWEEMRIYTSTDGGGSWSSAYNVPLNSILPTAPQVDLTNKIAGAADARISFRFDSVFDNAGEFWQVDDVQVEVYGVASTEPPPPLELPGQADLPGPVSGATGISESPLLSWVSAPNADSHNVYFGTRLDLQNSDFQGNQTTTQFSPGTLAAGTTYFWRIDEVNHAGTTTGVVWNFTTESAPEPPPSTGPTTLHVADIDGSAEALPRNRWQANVRVRVLDDEGGPVAGATVTGQWSDGANGSDTQSSDGAGWADFSRSNLKAGVSSVQFAVTGIAHASLAYAPADNSDPDGDSDGTVILVPRDAPPPPSNSTPSVTISAPSNGQLFADGNGIALVATATDVEEGDLSGAIVWQVNGVQVGSGASISHDFPDGGHTVSASAADTQGASGSDSVSITVGDPPSEVAVHVESLVDGSSADSRRWTALATVTVHDSGDSPASGVTVSASWSGGARGGASCVTGGGGQCSLSKGNLKLNVASVTLTIDNLSGEGVVHDTSGVSSIVLAP